MKIIQVVVVIIFLTSGLACAGTASEAAAEYFKVLQKKDFERAATFFDPAALTEFRTMMSFMNELPDEAQQAYLQAFFGPEANRETVAKLSDAKYFAYFFGAVMAQVEAMGGLNFEKMAIIGEVREGKDIAHVVTRNRVSVGEIEVEGMEVISFKKVGTDWKALLSGKIKGLPEQLKAALRRESIETPKQEQAK